jgi:hypothetical protein
LFCLILATKFSGPDGARELSVYKRLHISHDAKKGRPGCISGGSGKKGEKRRKAEENGNETDA